jgi:hypothetical protein
VLAKPLVSVQKLVHTMVDADLSSLREESGP